MDLLSTPWMRPIWSGELSNREESAYLKVNIEVLKSFERSNMW
jgi:hypothetical protein